MICGVIVMNDRIHVDSDKGLFVPTRLRGEGQIIFRTPRATIQMFGDIGAYYGLIDETHFGSLEDLESAQNPDLAPDQCKIKRAGEEPVVLAVEIHPDVITDGGVMTQDIVIEGPRGIVYGPRSDGDDGYVLTLASEDGRVEARLDEAAMYHLWTEVRGVPWPEPDEFNEKDRRVKQVLHAANGADLETLDEALRVLRGDRR